MKKRIVCVLLALIMLLGLVPMGASAASHTTSAAAITVLKQMTTFKDLKSNNEDVELEDIAIEFTEAETVYDAAIATASKTVRQTLLDYL